MSKKNYSKNNFDENFNFFVKEKVSLKEAEKSVFYSRFICCLLRYFLQQYFLFTSSMSTYWEYLICLHPLFFLRQRFFLTVKKSILTEKKLYPPSCITRESNRERMEHDVQWKSRGEKNNLRNLHNWSYFIEKSYITTHDVKREMESASILWKKVCIVTYTIEILARQNISDSLFAHHDTVEVYNAYWDNPQ